MSHSRRGGGGDTTPPTDQRTVTNGEPHDSRSWLVPMATWRQLDNVGLAEAVADNWRHWVGRLVDVEPERRARRCCADLDRRVTVLENRTRRLADDLAEVAP